jgi:hypothetical protein
MHELDDGQDMLMKLKSAFRPRAAFLVSVEGEMKE